MNDSPAGSVPPGILFLCCEVLSMKLTYSKSQFDIPEGQYIGKFLGLKMIEPKPGEAPRTFADGKPMAPGMSWQFLIQGGPENGKTAERVTSRLPTPKNVCGRLLVAVTGQILKDGMEIDLDQFVGRTYRLNVVEKDKGEGTYVSETGLSEVAAGTTIPGQSTAPANGHAPGTATNGVAPPPPRRSAPAAPQFYVEANPDADPLLMTEEAVRAWFNADATRDPGKINVCPVGGQDWKAASTVFDKLVPF